MHPYLPDATPTTLDAWVATYGSPAFRAEWERHKRNYEAAQRRALLAEAGLEEIGVADVESVRRIFK